MESRCEEEDHTAPPLELEDEAAGVIDAYDFVGFTQLKRKIQQGEKVVKLQKVVEEVREGGGGGGGEVCGTCSAQWPRLPASDTLGVASPTHIIIPSQVGLLVILLIINILYNLYVY